MNLQLCLGLFGRCLVLSLLTIGGAVTVAPDLHRLMVSETRLLTDTQFNASIAIAQASPGPNVLYVAVMGYQVAGVAGAFATLAGMMLPSSALALAAARWGHVKGDWRALQAFKAGMAPLTLALLFSTGWILTVHMPGWRHVLLTAATVIVVWRTRVHLLVLIAIGALLGSLRLL